MSITYKSLLASTEVRGAQGQCHCTRLRIISVVCVVLVAWILIMYSCMDRSKAGCCFSRGNVAFNTSRNTDLNEKFAPTKRRLPQAIIIGVRKGGTRALLRYLDIHPNVATVAMEVHYFDREENYSRGIDWYRRRMPFTTADQITMEKTPSYFNEIEVPERVYKMNSSIKLILLVRDPVERTISDYTQIDYNKVRKGKYHKPFRELAIDADTGRVRRSYVAVKRSLYYRHMIRWLDYFSLDNFLILDSQQLVDNPYDVVHNVETFLHLPHIVTKDNFYFNETRGFYCLKQGTEKRCLSDSKGRPHVPVDADTRDRLRAFFRPFNRKFYNLVGRNFGWL